MARVRKVVLLGNSVVASSLASTLRSRPDLEILQLAATLETAKRLRDARPDAIILSELATISPHLIFLLLWEHPGLLVIGVDVDGDRMVVLSGRQASLRTEDDLLEAIGQRRPLPGACQARPDHDSRAVADSYPDTEADEEAAAWTGAKRAGAPAYHPRAKRRSQASPTVGIPAAEGSPTKEGQ